MMWHFISSSYQLTHRNLTNRNLQMYLYLPPLSKHYENPKSAQTHIPNSLKNHGKKRKPCKWPESMEEKWRNHGRNQWLIAIYKVQMILLIISNRDVKPSFRENKKGPIPSSIKLSFRYLTPNFRISTSRDNNNSNVQFCIFFSQ